MRQKPTRTRTVLVDPQPEPGPVYTRPSKSQMKRDMTSLQVLGRELAALSKDRLAQLGLPERLHEALLAYRTITAHEGSRRQMQFIGRLMRDVDPEPLREALDRFNGASRAEVADMHLAERWRERLLEEGGNALTEFASAYAGADLTRIRTLIRNAQKETKEGKPPRDYRELYRAIRDAMATRQAPSQPDTPEEEGAPE
jgi:ribosome-associated protein